ncbi:hypothetical protein MATR_21040 [Marivirga tractuosa]|uniref:Uncharacterized protein n=1 Tax=Marivirga tractuosa (strain ATCC 23168 / DSM 4126 / NBRC 15989 / NCIMB 1408 / VKM B-1430 / H-43) TaxID=643867 RepID=E4TLY8_MARTH|nr:hypothetical protein [Marivirga tractuosa]ADR20279.1 hypothetical protein Ftrac_0270 [Marivirga tractuosa DSM 4126]BDD15279.1 hypothetical protein MATR_21040 [Marivirga tractuosa]
MSNIEALITRFEKHKNVTDAKFQFILDRQKDMESVMLELKEESSDFYGFVAESLREIDNEIKSIKDKIKDL